MRYTRLYCDQDGVSRFEDLDLAFSSADFSPPAPPVDVSEPIAATAFLMVRAPAGWSDPAHPAPARQFMMPVSGSFQVTAAGETRRFDAGEVLLVEDTSGPGHATTVLADALVAVVRV
jgi:hypothetical protein